ncbi:PAP2 superfamily protein [Asticcacaulis biprosthecium C19]|uniref:PAP2 superfamily protein n=1 Tax=Asticcacaulis biprosthecium C19 TaxID=715226 RepID=F4QLX0_9CAUL|nr:vanadium-dependent haloperoxidase [Asticcacaulis biprosthecium]EGF92389.1 PAP2 superfamily protein [Asticcacaulis biprosthecium C19]
MTAASPEYRFCIDMTLECIRRDHTDSFFPQNREKKGNQRGPFLTARALGMALAALRDAKAIANGRSAFLAQLKSHATASDLKGANPKVAAAMACAQVLRRRYPDQLHLINSACSQWLELFEPTPTPLRAQSQIAGIAFGDAIHELGKKDAEIAGVMYIPILEPYYHNAPPNEPNQGFAGSAWGTAAPLVAKRIENFPTPPGRVSPTEVEAASHYKRDYEEVLAKGISNRADGSRTLNEEIIGIYWGYDGPQELGTPPRLYLQIVLSVLDDIQARNKTRLSVDDELDIIAMIGISQADAAIDAWHYKYSAKHMMWRPALGIPNADPNHGTAPRRDWRPLGRPATNGNDIERTPDFPAYPSGHATFGAAAFQLLRLFLVEKGAANFEDDGGDNVDFDFVSDEFNGRNRDPRTGMPRQLLTRRYPSLWKAITDNSVSRVYLGVHWQFDGITTRNGASDEFGVPEAPKTLGHTGGVWLGVRIANQLAELLEIRPETINKSLGT